MAYSDSFKKLASSSSEQFKDLIEEDVADLSYNKESFDGPLDKQLYNIDRFLFDAMEILQPGPGYLTSEVDYPNIPDTKYSDKKITKFSTKGEILEVKPLRKKVTIKRVEKLDTSRETEILKPNTLSLEGGMREIYQARRTGIKNYRDVFDKFFINALIKLKVDLGPGERPTDVVFQLYLSAYTDFSKRHTLPPKVNTYQARLLYHIFYTGAIANREYPGAAWETNLFMPENSLFSNFEKESFFTSKRTKNFFKENSTELNYRTTSFYGNFNIKENVNLVTQDVFIDNAGNLIADLKFSMSSVSFLKLPSHDEGGVSEVLDYFFFLKEKEPSKGFFIKKLYKNGYQENFSNFNINYQSETNTLKSENNQTIQLEDMSEYRSEIESMISFISEVLELEGTRVYILPKEDFTKEVINNEKYRLERNRTGVFYKVEEVK